MLAPGWLPSMIAGTMLLALLIAGRNRRMLLSGIWYEQVG